MKKIIIYCTILLACALPALAYFNPGQPDGFVNDYADVLSAEQENALEAKLSQFENERDNEIAIVTIKSLDNDTIENFAVKLFEDWGIGKKKKDNGVLLLAAIDDRQMKIEVGYGLEGALTDAQSSWIIRDILRPTFKNNDYYGGIDQAVDRIMAITQGEYQPSDDSRGSGLQNYAVFYLYAIVFGFYFLISLRYGLAKSKSWWQGGVLGLIIGVFASIFLFKTFWYAAIFSGVLGIAGLVFDYLVSRVPPQPDFSKWKSGRGGFGGFGGGGFRGGGGFGGGGFGGGGSGGGGSSGGW